MAVEQSVGLGARSPQEPSQVPWTCGPQRAAHRAATGQIPEPGEEQTSRRAMTPDRRLGTVTWLMRRVCIGARNILSGVVLRLLAWRRRLGPGARGAPSLGSRIWASDAARCRPATRCHCWLAGEDGESPVVVVGQRSRTTVDADLVAAGTGARSDRDALGLLLEVGDIGERGDGNNPVVLVALIRP